LPPWHQRYTILVSALGAFHGGIPIPMHQLRFAILGTGFWARYQLAAWREVPGARCVALYNRTRSKAETLAHEFGVDAVHDSAEELIRAVKPDFLDIITDVGTHRKFVELAAAHRIPAICQKPMAPTLEDAEAMVAVCRGAGVPLFIHENWRWQAPIRAFKSVMDEGRVGRAFRARIDFCSSFPVFDNQPFLKELDQFILTDMGSHILDVARFLFGEPERLYCRTARIHRDIRGEDVATVLLSMRSGATVVVNLSYASRTEHERFPETFIHVEADQGSVELAPDFWIRVTTKDGTVAWRHPPPVHPWADPAYGVVHSSIVACNEDIFGALSGRAQAETGAEDNLRTVRLVFASYLSAAEKRAVALDEHGCSLLTRTWD
jgi:D-apiose dehydrogenase